MWTIIRWIINQASKFYQPSSWLVKGSKGSAYGVLAIGVVCGVGLAIAWLMHT